MATAKRTSTIGMADPERCIPAFVGTPKPPGPDELATRLSKSYSHWKALLDFVERAVPSATTEWKHATPRSGWSLTVRDQKRNLAYLRPSTKCFLTSLAFKDAAVDAAARSDLPASLIESIRHAPIFPEGRPVRIAVRTGQEAGIVKRLIQIKIDN